MHTLIYEYVCVDHMLMKGGPSQESDNGLMMKTSEQNHDLWDFIHPGLELFVYLKYIFTSDSIE